jgi:hypothetical protein
MKRGKRRARAAARRRAHSGAAAPLTVPIARGRQRHDEGAELPVVLAERRRAGVRI